MPTNSTPPQEKPIERSDPEGWVDRYGDALYRFARCRVETHELAEDLVQETFLAAFRHRSQFNGRSDFGTWLIAILRRKIVDHRRKTGRPVGDSDDGLAPNEADERFTADGKWSRPPQRWSTSPGDVAENAEFWRIFHDCLSDLPSHFGDAFQLREIRMISVEDASRLAGITRENLAVRLHRARLLLRECLERKWFRGDRGGVL